MTKTLSKLDKIISERHLYDKESQKIIDNICDVQKEHDIIFTMKRTQGWKVLEKKMKEELHNRILEMVKSDATIQTLLAILTAADTKGALSRLESEIDELLP